MSGGAAGSPTTGRLRVAVAGASGRMGRALIEAITSAPDLVLAGALDAPGSAALGAYACTPTAGDAGVRIVAVEPSATLPS